MLDRLRWILVAAGLVLIGWAGVLWVQRLPPPATPPSAPVAPLPSAAELAAPLPFDAAITTGTFPNGLRYYVRTNRYPEHRAELRLVVNAGSVLEDDDQRGLAHFVEHMAFNGTRHFPKQAIGAFMESIGMRFGPSVNATTTFDETVYTLQIPTDAPAVIDRALLILEDWAHGVAFDAAEIEKERGVVLEEWRLRRGAGARFQDIQLPILLAGSRYADRLPIGTPDSIRTFVPDRLRQFYKDWYRPDLMAVIAVGDFDGPAMEGLVKKHFAAIPSAASPRPRPVFEVPARGGTAYAIAEDAEASATSITLYNRRAPREAASVGDYRRELVERLVAGMWSNRLGEVAQRTGGPFLAANASRGRLVRALDVTTATAQVADGGIESGLAALVVEAARLARFGFTQSELDRQETVILRGFEQAMADKDRRPSASLAAEYARNFTMGESVPGLEAENDMTGRFLPGISLDEVNAVSRDLFPNDNRVIAVSARARAGVSLPTVARLETLMASAERARLTPWVPRVTATALLDEEPTPGSIASRMERPQGIVEWTLSNGARVIVKPTTFKEDEVAFSAMSPGGTSLASDREFVAAETAAQVVGTMGFGRFSSGDLRRALIGKVVAVQPVIGPYEAGLTGQASRQDLETLFQLIYLTFTAPRRDPTIFEGLRSQMRAALSSQGATPEFAFDDALARALSSDHPRAQPLRAATVEAMNMDQSLAFYKARFADASGFTFVFVGSVDPAAIQPLVERYVASLPTLRRHETWQDVGIRPPRGVVERRVEKGLEPKGRTAIVFTGPAAADRATAITLGAAGEVLQMRLRDALREELGGTYSVTVAAGVARVPKAEYRVAINFGSDPARIDALVARVFQEIARLKADGPTERQVADVVEALLRDFEANVRQNGFLRREFAERCAIGEAPESLYDAPALYRELTVGRVRDAARLALDPANYVKVTLVPEKR